MTNALMLSDDLLFTSRVTATARAAGLSVTPARGAGELLKLARAAPPRCVIVDLHNPGLDVGELIAGLRAACDPMPRVIAYGSHVEAAALRAARAAGCDEVMPRSRFVEVLEEALPGWLS